MKARSRYALLTTGIVLFIIGVPLIIIFVSGYRYDFSNRHFVRTGALNVRSDPSGATISLNGKASGKTQKTFRFLLPGEYDISISKNGYFTWEKQLLITADNVTLAHYGYSAITLFFTRPIVTVINNSSVNNSAAGTPTSTSTAAATTTTTSTAAANQIEGFFAGQKHLVYVENNYAYLADIGNLKNSSELALPSSFDSAGAVSITASADENYFLLSAAEKSQQAVFSVADNKLYGLQSLLNTGTAEEEQFGDNGNLYAIENGGLYQIDWRNNKNIPLIAGGIIGFSYHQSNIYALALAGTSAEQLSTLEQINPQTQQATVLYSGLPKWSETMLYLNQLNQIAIVGDGTLYSLSAPSNSSGTNSGGSQTNYQTLNLQMVQQYVTGVEPQQGSVSMFYATHNEIGTFDPSSGTIDPITRLSQTIDGSGISLNTGWAFYISNGTLNAIELDARDHQNTYQIERVDAGASFSVDSDAKYIYLLNDGILDRLQIR
jgi:hypothetical protein